MRILIIEDNKTIIKSIKLILRRENISCDAVETGKDGLKVSQLQPHYDLIILDLMLPDVSGFNVLENLRANHIKTPVLIVSGLATTDEKVKGLSLGADDYLTKPFNRNEFLERVKALIRRSNKLNDLVLKIGNMQINTENQTVKIAGVDIYIAPQEYRLLQLLAKNKNTWVSKQKLIECLYAGKKSEPKESTKILLVLMCKLRKALCDASAFGFSIHTNRAKGYMLEV